MSEKRYDTKNDNTMTERGPSDDYIVDASTGKQVYYPNDLCDLLNAQAETIEVLREWILEGGGSYFTEMRIIKNSGCFTLERVELAKRRLAALEGE